MNWKYINGYNKEYSISESGIVYSHKKNKFRKNVIVRGYYRTVLWTNAISKNFQNHILVATHFISDKPFIKAQVNHKDGNKLNNHFSNLEWVTQSENQKHAHRTGLKKSQSGESNFGSKLRNSDIPQIRKMIVDGRKMNLIANEFNVTANAICCIKKGRSWNYY